MNIFASHTLQTSNTKRWGTEEQSLGNDNKERGLPTLFMTIKD